MSGKAYIHFFDDPAAIQGYRTDEVKAGTKLLDHLITVYGPDGFKRKTKVFKGRVALENEVDLELYINDGFPLFENDHFYVFHAPEEVSTWVYIVLAVVTAVVAVNMVDIPANPSFGQPEESPNNSLHGQTNVARPLERIPDIFGAVRSYPDLMARSRFEYVNNLKIVTEWLCYGRGSYQISSHKIGNTLVSGISGSSVVVYTPNVAVPSTFFDVEANPIVDGMVLPAPNDLNLVTGASGEWTANRFLSSNDGKFANLIGIEEDVEVTISGGNTNDQTTILTNFSEEDGAYKYEMQFTFGDIVTETSTNTITIDRTSTGAVVGPYPCFGTADEIWIDIQAPRGLVNNGSDTVAVDFDIHIQELDSEGGSPVGGVQTISKTVAGATNNPLFWTFKLIPTNAGNWYEVSIERTSNDNKSDTDLFDEIKWSRLASKRGVTVPNNTFGDITYCRLERRATVEPTSGQSDTYNAEVVRKLPTYDVDTQTVDPTLTATRKFADAFFYHATDATVGNRTNAQIDLDALYTIQKALDDDATFAGKKGEFSFTFSNPNTPAMEELRVIANAARCFVTRTGQVISVTRDEKQTTRKGLFNRRNKKPDSETKSITFSKPTDFDGVELEYSNIDTGDVEIIEVNDGSAVNPMKIEAAGIRQYVQAYDRAWYEFNKLKYQRVHVQTIVTTEGYLVAPNDRVGNVDATDAESQDGEVIGIDGFNVETSEPVTFGGGAHSVILRDEDGVPDAPIFVTTRFDGVNGFVLSQLPSFPIRVRGDGGNQVGTLYQFASDTEFDNFATDYQVVSITPEGEGYAQLELVNYTDDIYDKDNFNPEA